MTGYDWDFGFLWPLAPAFLRGAGVTLFISFASFFWGTIVGAAIGVLLHHGPLKTALLMVNDAIRALPVLVLIFIFYYLPYDHLFGVPAPGAITASIFALGVSQAAYTADLVRGAVGNVPQGIIDGAKALGLRSGQIWRFVIIPDVARQVTPALMAFFIGIVRLSSLASVIGASDIVFVARISIAQSFRSMEAWLIVALLYIVIVLPLTWVSRIIEQRMTIRWGGHGKTFL
jgi:His/Glu/Gln/Arg/opine family amino acid ABC transporter permease subunit